MCRYWKCWKARITPATYLWDQGESQLSITLASNESLTVSGSSGSVSFQLSQDTFSNDGGNTAPQGDGTATITFPDSDLSETIDIAADNSDGTNNVTFNGGSISSEEISVDISAGTGAISVTNGTSLSSSSTIEFTTPQNIVVDGGSTVLDNGQSEGEIAFNANVGTNSTGSFAGIEINGATVKKPVRRKSSSTPWRSAGQADGILLENDAVVESTSTASTAAEIDFMGVGGSSSSPSDGIDITSGSTVTTAGQNSSESGEIFMQGTGGSGGAGSNDGINIDGSGTQVSVASGLMELNGTGGAGTTGDCIGINVADSAAVELPELEPETMRASSRSPARAAAPATATETPASTWPAPPRFPPSPPPWACRQEPG